jgi:hypothetical protein
MAKLFLEIVVLSAPVSTLKRVLDSVTLSIGFMLMGM